MRVFSVRKLSRVRSLFALWVFIGLTIDERKVSVNIGRTLSEVFDALFAEFLG